MAQSESEARHKPLERRMPHHAIVSDFQVGDLSIKTRLNPRRVPLERFRQRRCGPRKGLQSTRPAL
jgi:hypothetical protein